MYVYKTTNICPGYCSVVTALMKEYGHKAHSILMGQKTFFWIRLAAQTL